MSNSTGRVLDARRERSAQATAIVLREVSAAGYSREELARRIDLSTASIKRWESGDALVPLALLTHPALSSERRLRIATTLIEHDSPAILPIDCAERSVVVAALDCVREIVAPANDNAHSATVTDLTLYRSVVRLRKACDSLLASLPAEVRRAA